MNTSDQFGHGLNISSQMAFSNDPPPGAPFGWPGCTYPLPLPPTGYYVQVTKWIWKTVPMLLILLGTVGNILTALVIFRNFRKLSSTAVYLLTLAVADTLFLYNEPLRRFILNVFEFDIHSINDLGCKISAFLIYTSFHISAWILVAVTIERVISVLFPYTVKRRCTKRNALVVSLVIVITICVMDSHVLYGFGNFPSDKREGSCTQATYGEYSIFYEYQWFWVHLTFGFATPFVFIVIGNVLVIHGLRKMRKRQRWMDDEARNGQVSHGLRRGRHARTLMIMLILLSTTFFISQTPLAIFLVYFQYIVDDLNQLACSDFQTYMDGKEKLWLWEAITHSFGYLNASINFVQYVISGSRFRREIISLLMCRNKMQIRTPSMSSSGYDNGSRRHRQHSNNIYHINSDDI